MRVHLVNPSHLSFGVAVITPRWQYVLAAATPQPMIMPVMYSCARPARRSIGFLAVTAEESGLLGSRYYAEHPIYPLGKTVGGVNMDGLNIFGATKDFEITGAGRSRWRPPSDSSSITNANAET